MKFSFITLFKELVEPYFRSSILGRAVKNGLLELDFINPRDFSSDKHKKVDEYMIGGGAGLLMMARPLTLAIDEALKYEPNSRVIYLTPNGKKFTQKDAKRLARFSSIIFVCGRYEGIDERVIERSVNEVFCLGDFILTGGELAALCMSDAISRNIKGVLGNSDSLVEESFENSLLEAPNFTKPNVFEENCVISEFLKGNHAKISALKNNLSKARTRYYRPDLYNQRKHYEK